MSVEFQTVPLSKLRESKSNPRTHFDAKALGELAQSIKNHGILTPILVRPSNGHFEIAAGHRRFRAAKAAGIDAIPVVVREMSDAELLEVLVIENLQREDVHPLEEAEGYRQLLKKTSWEVEAIAAKVGKSLSYVYQRLKLAELIDSAKKAFLEGKITAGHAILIARLQPEDQKKCLEYCSHRYNSPSVRDLAEYIEREVLLELSGAPWKKDDATLLPAAGACTACPKRTGANTALFEDLAKKDRCLDSACFAKKEEAFVARRAAELKEESGAAPLKISTEYGGYGRKKSTALTSDQWREAKAGSCKSEREALVVEGDRVGQTTHVCVDKACKTHGTGRYSSYNSASDGKRRAADAKKQERQSERRLAIFTAVVEASPKKLGLEDLRGAARRRAYFRRDLLTTVYVVRTQPIIDGLGCIKIGIARDVQARLRAIRTDCPLKVELAGEIRCATRDKARWIERLLHKGLSYARVNGEWFMDDRPNTIDFIDMFLEGAGIPERLQKLVAL